MAKRKGRYRKKRISKKSNLEELIVSFMFSLFLLGVILILLKEAVVKIASFFVQLDILGWTITFVFCAFLFGLYFLAKQREKKFKEFKQQARELKLIEYRVKQTERIKAKSQLESIKEMHHFEFEYFMKEVFELLGYKANLTPKTGDGGKDILLHKNKELILVECKRFNKTKVTRPDIQKFHSAIIDMEAKRGYFVTTGAFTKQAIEYALNKSIELINGEELIRLLQKATIDIPNKMNIGEEINEQTKR
ncbi:restriction system protein [Bacillus tianshenii]|uniref:Restriction system protein n=1 Tax=Sutcliffiella tianshenii TaxID=1463404 RepID=A0ABS2NZQ0_9BACI|nr:restriction endonuclease [Bacillus tianshenii]MBM7620176.1 restriction system protein [Bacillus tianshenii]